MPVATTSKKLRFSLYVHFYVWSLLLLLAFTPLYVVSIKTLGFKSAVFDWSATAAWAGLIVILYRFAQVRCSSTRLGFQDGLLLVAASMMTGWSYISFFIVLPVLFVVFWGSVLIALRGSMPGAAQPTTEKWLRFIGFFHRNRMFQ